LIYLSAKCWILNRILISCQFYDEHNEIWAAFLKLGIVFSKGHFQDLLKTPQWDYNDTLVPMTLHICHVFSIQLFDWHLTGCSHHHDGMHAGQSLLRFASRQPALGSGASSDEYAVMVAQHWNTWQEQPVAARHPDVRVRHLSLSVLIGSPSFT
jgi:hypothetical protein